MSVFTKIKVTINIWKPSLEKMTQNISLIPICNVQFILSSIQLGPFPKHPTTYQKQTKNCQVPTLFNCYKQPLNHVCLVNILVPVCLGEKTPGNVLPLRSSEQ